MRPRRQSTLNAKKIVYSDSEDSESIYESCIESSDQSESESESKVKRIRVDEDQNADQLVAATSIEPAEPETNLPTTQVEIVPPQFQPRRRVIPKPKVPKVPLDQLHPELKNVWKDLENAPKYDTSNQRQPEHVLVKLLPFQLEGLSWLQQQEQSEYKGGILADEMGMGKTIQMISLIVSRLDVRPNLIITPTVALMQWYSELQTKTTPGLLKIVLFHGAKRELNKKELESADIVLTTYAILEQSYRKEHYGTKRKGQLVKAKSLLHSIHWGRMILDEAHAIKDRYCSTAKASFALDCDYKWSMSGTPLQNRVGELFSLIRLMNLDPHSYYFCTKCECKMQHWSFKDRMHCDECGHTGHQHFCYWNREILKPIQKYGSQGDGLGAFKKLSTVLDSIMLRRTKNERNDELGLPPRIVECRRDVFNDAEEELYDSLYSDTNRTFNTYVAEGTVLNNYASIFSLLSRMRLAANHPDLVTTKLQPKETKSVCVVCHDEAEDPILSKCKHIFCREDARQYIQSVPAGEIARCPSCVRELTIDLTQPELLDVNPQSVQTSIVNQLDLENWRSSTKIEAIVEELTHLKSENATAKALVFSQFVSFLDLLHWRLSRAGFNVVKLDGRMGPDQRATIIDRFMKDPSVTVFLISLKAGGTALNLTEASHVFIADPWWNPAVENQCMDRIHRLGQYRPIKIKRMIIENSIESRILELQQKKKALFDSTIGNDMTSLARLTEEDFQFLFVL